MSCTILLGDCRQILATLPAGSVRCAITSPPYYGLRDYGTAAWEGGDAGCDHLAPPRRGSGTYSTTSTLGPKKDGLGPDNAAWHVTERQFADLCGKCGARRVDRQIGLEPSIAEFVAALVGVFREVRRVLTPDGTLWLNLGDSFSVDHAQSRNGSQRGKHASIPGAELAREGRPPVLGPKQLLMIPARVALALQADGWILRSDIIWKKSNPMPESVTDRPTKSHEHVFLLAKSPRYFFDAEAVREAATNTSWATASRMRGVREQQGPKAMAGERGDVYGTGYNPAGRNVRDVWTFPGEPFKGSHFATMPSALAARCVRAGTSERGRCPECSAPWIREVQRTRFATRPGTSSKVNGLDASVVGNRDPLRHCSESVTTGWRPTCDHGLDPVPDVVLDPFAGAGTTLLAADRLHRDGLGIELNPAYREMALRRIASDEDLPLFGSPAAPPASAPLPGQMGLFDGMEGGD